MSWHDKQVPVFYSIVLGFLLFASPPALSYKFLCNGIDADGIEEGDYCGACTNASAPRWTPSSVDVLVDVQVRPPKVSEADWKKVVTASLAAWNDIPGVNLSMNVAGLARHRSFGSHASSHEIFWVLDKKEWRQKVGSGENGTLGVTVTPYHCPFASHPSREIYDADLIMNGVNKINWQVDCTARSNCETLGSTLTHELGHFVGLGHPCIDCDWSIMSAQASEAEIPLRDDHDGLKALYPSGLSGQMGTRCENHQDCTGDLKCVTQNETKFCSRQCSSMTCPAGYVCEDPGARGGAFCKFATGRLARPARMRERCETKPCEDGLQCVEAFTGNSYCAKECSTRADCPSSEACVMFPEGGLGVCLQVAPDGELCAEFITCGENSICVGKNELDGICRMACDPTKKRQCPGGQVCTSVGNGLGACLDTNVLTIESVVSENTATKRASPQAVQTSQGCSCSVAQTESKSGLIGLLGIVIGLFLRYVGLLSRLKSRRTV